MSTLHLSEHTPKYLLSNEMLAWGGGARVRTRPVLSHSLLKVEDGPWSFIKRPWPLSHLFKIFHNKKLKNQRTGLHSESRVVEDPGWLLSAQMHHPQNNLATWGHSEVNTTDGTWQGLSKDPGLPSLADKNIS